MWSKSRLTYGLVRSALWSAARLRSSEWARQLARKGHVAGERVGVAHVLCDRVRVGCLETWRVRDARGCLVSALIERAHLVEHRAIVGERRERLGQQTLERSAHALPVCVALRFCSRAVSRRADQCRSRSSTSRRWRRWTRATWGSWTCTWARRAEAKLDNPKLIVNKY